MSYFSTRHGWVLRAFVVAFFCYFLSLSPAPAGAALGTPQPQAVYGGSITWINGYPLSATVTRVFISTYSANTMFYADVDHGSGTPSFGAFQVVPDLDYTKGFGTSVQRFAVDQTTGKIFFNSNGALYTCTVTAGSIQQLVPSGVGAITAYGGKVFWLKGDKLHFGTVSSGTEDAGSPVTVTGLGNGLIRLMVNKFNHKVYIFKGGNPPAIYVSSGVYNSLSGSTFAALSVTALGTELEYNSFGIGPDGRVFAAASNLAGDPRKYIAYTDTEGESWTTFNSGMWGIVGPNVTTSGDAASYTVYVGSAMSTSKGENGTWHTMPNGGAFDSHANDGAIYADPNRTGVVYLTTDAGIGVSINSGVDLQDINNGVLAVQIADLDMNAAKTIAWSASKSGVRRVANYGTPSEAWSTSFPMSDGSPYFSIAMDKSDASGNSAYAANLRVYTTTDGGSSWSRIFALDNEPGFDFAAKIPALALSASNPDLLFVGAKAQTPNMRGGIFYTANAKAGSPVWSKLDTGSADTQVRDLLMVEDEDSIKVYAACEYTAAGGAPSYGVKTVTYAKTGGAVSYSNDMNGQSGTITTFGALSLAKNTLGDIYAAGVDNTDAPKVYVKSAAGSTWQALVSTGLPAKGTISALTIGQDAQSNETPFVAMGDDIYYLNGSAWSLAYRYPAGTEINVLYWDDLLVGTGAGLFAQFMDAATCTYTLSKTSNAFRAAKGSVTIRVTGTGTGCTTPQITSNADWASGTALNFRNNRGNVRISVLANPSSQARAPAATITIAGQTFTVTQDGAICSMRALSPPSVRRDNQPFDGSFTVSTTPSDCEWSATADAAAPWVTVGAIAGSTVGYSILGNSSSRTRVGKIHVTLSQNPAKKKIFTINQRK
ncbi:MAG TPA: hypothetical protein VGJ94_19205 [Syntrophorhabdaceae bacterium]|jgi:hypothetical protein